MKLNLFFLCFTLFSISSYGNENSDYLVKQGNIKVTLQDIDSFAYTIPDRDRFNYFNSVKRIDTLVKNILVQNHLVSYTKNNVKLDLKTLTFNADKKAQELFTKNYGLEFSSVKENRIMLMKQFYLKRELIGALHSYLRNNIKDTDLEEIVLEEYESSPDKFKTKAKYNFQMFGMFFNHDTFSQKENQAKHILKKLLAGEIDIKTIDSSNAKVKYKLDFIKKINNFEISTDVPVLSDFIETNNRQGLINKILILDDKILLINITNITPAILKEFAEVKQELLKKYRQIKLQNDLDTLILSITQDPIEVNEEILLSLMDRYKPVE